MASAPVDIRSFFANRKKKIDEPASSLSSDLASSKVLVKRKVEVETKNLEEEGTSKETAVAIPESTTKPKKPRRVIEEDSDEEEFDLDTTEVPAEKQANKDSNLSTTVAEAEKSFMVVDEPPSPAVTPQPMEKASTEASNETLQPAKKSATTPPTSGFFAPKSKKAVAAAPSTVSGSTATTSSFAPSASSKASSSSSAAAEVAPAKTGPVPYALLCDAFVKIDEITGRLEITSIMTSLFEDVMAANPEDLESVLFLASNKVAPPHANVILGIGDSILIKCIVQTFGRTTSAVKEQYDEEGDLGIVAEMSRSSQKQLAWGAKPKPLMVTQVLKALRTIAEIEGNKSQDRKIGAIQKLLRDCRGPEARFLIRALQGKLRIGLAETTVLIALAHAVVRSPPMTALQNYESEQQQEGNGATEEDEMSSLGRGDGEVPLEAEVKLYEYLKKQQKAAKKAAAEDKAVQAPTPPQDVLDAAVVLVKQAFAECSDHGKLSRALLRAPLHQVRKYCHLVPGTPVSPMLAKPTKSVDEVLKRLSGQRLTVEYKYDGERMQLHRLPDGSVRIFSRSQEDTTQRWPEIASSKFWQSEVFTKPLAKEGGDGSFVLDAEVVAWDTEKKVLLPFQVLSTRKRKADETEEQKVRIIVQGFDLLYLHGKSLLRQPLIVRRRHMYDAFEEVEGKFTFAKAKDVDLRDEADKKRDREEEAKREDQSTESVSGSSTAKDGNDMDVEKLDTAAIVAAAAAPSSSSSSTTDSATLSAEEGEQMIAAFMNDAVEGFCEGLMVKTLYGASATYEPSVRSLNWLKLKKDYMDSFGGADSLDLVPIGAYAGKGKRTGVWGAYLLAVYDGDSEEFQSVCKIGTGFSDIALKELSDQFEEHQYPEGCARPRMYQLGDSLEPDVYFKPVKVWEVRAADLSLSSTHKGGIGKPGIEAGRGVGLRFPRFIRARDDKPPENATSAQQIRDMYFEQQCVDSSAANTGGMAEDDEFL